MNYEDVQKLSNAAKNKIGLLNGNFQGTSLAGIDLTTDDIDGLLLMGGELKGAVVTLLQAANLAKLLGVVIKE